MVFHRLLPLLSSLVCLTYALKYHNFLDRGYTITPGSSITIDTKDFQWLELSLLPDISTTDFFKIKYSCGSKPTISWKSAGNHGDNTGIQSDNFDCGYSTEILISFTSDSNVEVYQRRGADYYPWITGVRSIGFDLTTVKVYQLEGEFDTFSIYFNRMGPNDLVNYVKENGLKNGDVFYLTFAIDGNKDVFFEITRGTKKRIMTKLKFHKMYNGNDIGLASVQSDSSEERCWIQKKGIIKILIQVQDDHMRIYPGVAKAFSGHCASYFDTVPPHEDPNTMEIRNLDYSTLIRADIIPSQINTEQ